MGGAHLPLVALWVTDQLYKHFPPLVTQKEASSWSWVEGVCSYTLTQGSRYSEIKRLLAGNRAGPLPGALWPLCVNTAGVQVQSRPLEGGC